MRGTLPSFVALASLLPAGSAVAVEPLPELQVAQPAGWTRAVDERADVDLYLATSPAGADLAVYPFRPFRGDLQRQFQATLLRELVSTRRREESLAAAPRIETMAVRGADDAVAAFFVGQRGGAQFVGVRLAVLAGGAVAVVDFNAGSAELFQRHWPTVLTALQPLAVVRRSAAPAPAAAPQADPPPATGPFQPGLFLAQGRLHYKMHVDFSGRTGGSWYNDLDTEWYLLSGDGRVQRGWGLPQAPGGDVRRFDYQNAQRQDPANAGTYSVRDGKIVLSFPSRKEVLDGRSLASGDLEIRGVVYKRAGAK